MRTLMAFLAATTLVACGSSGGNTAGSRRPAAPGHVHTLAVNPIDGALFVAAHSGLFRVASDRREPTLVPGSERDTMGFAIVGPDRFLASGHAPGDGSALGLTASSNAGRSWQSVVLEGKADLHIIRAGRKVLYADDAASGRLFEGAVGGRSLSARTTPPGTMLDLAVDPRSDRRVYATTDRGLFLSTDGARGWRRVSSRRTGLLAFRDRTLMMVDGQGRISALPRLGRPWREVGALPDRAVALASGEDGQLYVALIDDSLYVSNDGGRNWHARLPERGSQRRA